MRTQSCAETWNGRSPSLLASSEMLSPFNPPGYLQHLFLSTYTVHTVCVCTSFLSKGLHRYSFKTIYLTEFAYDIIFPASAIFYKQNVKLEPLCRVTIFDLFTIHFLTDFIFIQYICILIVMTTPLPSNWQRQPIFSASVTYRSAMSATSVISPINLKKYSI
jgi:hypothetical protein